MANRHGVNAPFTWDATAGSKWALTSGGAGGQAVPTNADDVFLDGNTAGNVTISGSRNCLGFDTTGFTNTFAGSGALFTYGDVVLDSGMTYTHSGGLYVFGSGTRTFDAGGVSISASEIFFQPTSGECTLISDIVHTGNQPIGHTGGILNFNGFDITTNSFTGNTSSTRELNLGSGTITLIGDQSNLWAMSSDGLTFDAGTSTIEMTGALVDRAFFYGGGLSYATVINNTTGASPLVIEDSNSFANLTIAAGREQLFAAGSAQTIDEFIAVGSSGNEITIGSSGADDAIATTEIANAGEDYLEFDQLQVDAGDFNAFITVLAVDGGGAITDYSVDQLGSGYSVASNVDTTNFSSGGTGFQINILSVTPLGTHTLSKASGVVACDYLILSNSIATGGADWYAGSNSVDNGGNVGWIFDDPPAPVGGTGNFLAVL